ncbi:MAG: hypothetical protein IPJ65_21380 [Archangiaceae bacterium]|nr:hypothetical protein [Archangiaceae bacterium]
MANISRKAIHDVLDRTAQTLIDAAGKNGRLSRAEVAAKLKELTGSERALTDTFFQFLDHRDAAKGATVTAGDITQGLAYAKQKLIDAYDLTNNGLSPDEVGKMAQIGKLASAIAQLHLTPTRMAMKAAEVLVTPKWSPDALPALDPAELSHSAKESFDAMARRAKRMGDLIDPPIARSLTASGQRYAVVAQFTHDSFGIELYNPNGRRVAHGSGWGTPDAPIQWD